MSYTLTYNGVELTDPNGAIGLDVLAATRTLLPPIRYSEIAFGIEDGGVILGGARGSMTLAFMCSLYGFDAADLRSRTNALKNTFDTRADKAIEYEEWPDEVFYGRPSGGIEATRYGEIGIEFTLEFTIPKAESYVSSPVSIPFDIASTPYDAVIDADDVHGTGIQVPTVEIHAAHSVSPSISLSNLLDGTVLTAQFTSAGGYFRFDSQAHQLLFSTDGNDWSVMTVPLTGPFPVLHSGIENTIRVTGAGACTMTVSYRERFV